MEPGNNERGGQGLAQGGREKKKERKYYGKLLIFIIFIVLSIEYYAYVFEVMLKYMTPKNFNLILTLSSSFINGFYFHYVDKPWRDTFILGILHRR